MDPNRIREFARNFPENGMKLLLEHPKNVRDLLMLVGRDIAERIDLDGLRYVKETFVRRDYRHVEGDVVHTAPLRTEPRGRERVCIYILIEHQSEPDRLMPLRLIDYVVQILRFQERDWERQHGSTDGIRLQPVLPVVFYTGEKRWPALGALPDLIDPAAGFREWTPRMDSFFVNVRAIEPGALEAFGGFFGHVLRLVTARRARRSTFQKRLVSVIRSLEAMPAQDRLRWLELLSYIHALVYHVRHPKEQPGLFREIEASVATDVQRQEVFQVGRTIADELKEQAGIETTRKNLVRLLGLRFGDVPEETVAVIESTRDLKRLNGWLDLVVTAETLEQIGIG